VEVEGIDNENRLNTTSPKKMLTGDTQNQHGNFLYEKLEMVTNKKYYKKRKNMWKLVEMVSRPKLTKI
jgi:hypothetical protein